MKRIVFTLIILMFTSMALMSSGVFAQPTPAVGANIGFGAAVSDDEILQLLQRHDVAPAAVFVWTYGLTGAHRTYEAKSAQAFLQDARAKTAETFEKSLQGTGLIPEDGRWTIRDMSTISRSGRTTLRTAQPGPTCCPVMTIVRPPASWSRAISGPSRSARSM